MPNIVIFGWLLFVNIASFIVYCIDGIKPSKRMKEWLMLLLPALGGGFGGCTINLVKEELYDQFIRTAIDLYAKKFGRAPKIYDIVSSDGARKL